MPKVQPSGILAVTTLAAILCSSTGAFAAGVVTSANESSLTTAMAGGGTVTFAVNGTIYLTNTIVVSNNTVLDATGYNVAVDGSNAVSLFAVNSNVSFTLKGLTLANGLAQATFIQNAVSGGNGGALSNAGSLQVIGCVLSNNAAVGYNGNAYEDHNSSQGFGGAIFSAGSLIASNSLFINNHAVGGNGRAFAPPSRFYPTAGSSGLGAAAFNTGSALVVNCVFSNNQVTGGNGALGNPEYSDGANSAPGTDGGSANGGAIYNSGLISILSSTIVMNCTAGGEGGAGAYGYYNGGTMIGGTGGAGGDALGGGFYAASGTAAIVNCTLVSNVAIGGNGGPGGAGSGGAFAREPGGAGGSGGGGANAIGGAICLAGGALDITNATLANNFPTGGSSGAGGPGGPGYYGPNGPPGANGQSGIAKGDSIGVSDGQLVLKNSILYPNMSSDTNIFGSLIDAGHNINSDFSDSLTNSTSLNGINPDLAPLGNYGGLTPTMAMLPGSPAIDAADPADFPATDQRGRPRPFGAAPDIGAFEFSPTVTISGQIAGLMPADQITVTAGCYSTLTTSHGAYEFPFDDGPSCTVAPTNANYVFVPPAQTISVFSNQTVVNFQAYRLNAITLGVPSANSLNLAFAGSNGQRFRIEASTNFAGWTPIATNTISAAGYVSASFPLSNSASQFFRLVSP